MKRFILIGLLGWTSLTACGHAFEVVTPPGFVELNRQDDAGYAYRATSADGLVVAVRELDNDPKGELGFWERAIENQLRQKSGYSLLEKRPAQSANRVPGTELRFGHDEGKIPHLYHVTVFVTDRHIFLIEQGGKKDQVTQNAALLQGMVTGFVAK